MADPVGQALDELVRSDAVERLWDRDPSLFSPDPGEQALVADRLGWLGAAAGDPDAAVRLQSFTEAVRDAGLGRFVVAGMGGSSLAPEVFSKVFTDSGGEALRVLDSTHPDAVRTALDEADLSATLVVVSSKSGTTIETNAFAARAEALLPSSGQLTAVTDPGSPLADRCEEAGWRECWLNDPAIGGRYSALSYFGMLPASLAGVDIDAVWASAIALARRCGPDTPAADNPAAHLAAFLVGHARSGRDKLTVLTHPRLASLGDWIEQLVAESTGKDGTGIVPVVGEPTPEHGYSDDRVFVALRLAGEPAPGEDAAAGHPLFACDLDTPEDLGGAFLRWELATAWAGLLLGVNPFDEPNVAESKASTNRVLQQVTAGGTLPEPEDGHVESLLDRVGVGDYVSLQAYLPPTQDWAHALDRLRAAVLDHCGVPTTVGWGPRFLHSTGQLHKGGPDSLVAVQLVDRRLWDDPALDLAIPGADYGFSTLLCAQAAGDLRSLRAHDRRVVQVAVRTPADIDALAARLPRGGVSS